MRIINALTRTATPLRLLIAAIAMTLIRYGVMPRLGAQVMNTPGAGPLDLMFAYSPAQAFATLAAFSDAGRAAYRLFLMTADVAYPITYTLFFAWSIALLSRTTRWANSRWLLLPPLLLFGFDMAENATVIALISLHPAQPVWLALLASVFTTLKWMWAGVTMVITVTLAAMRVMGRIHAKGNSNA